MTKALLKTLPVRSVNELLAYVAGVDVRQRGPWGTQADIGIDGGTFDQDAGAAERYQKQVIRRRDIT